MAKTAAQQVLDEVIREALLPPLKADGFRKDGHTFRCAKERCIQVLNVQTSRYASAQELKFTLNLGLHFPEVQEVLAPLWRWRVGRAGPREYECHVHARIGALMPSAQDHWWDLRAADGREQVVKEVSTTFMDHGRPWLASFSDFETARAAKAFTSPVARAAFALVAGDRDDARNIVASLLSESPQATAFATWAKGLGLL